MALVVAVLVFRVALLAGRHADRLDLVLPARLAAVMVLVQVMLGAAAVLTRLAVVPTTLHLVNGALLLAILLVVALRAARGRTLAMAASGSVPGAQGIRA
jgi:heme A synthase